MATLLLDWKSADLDNDGDVDFEDFAIFALAWQSSPGVGNWDPIVDISKPADNVIDLLDFAVLREYWLWGN